MSRKSSYQKGNKYENEVKKILEQQGWQVFKQHRKPMFIKGNLIMAGCDIFGCDIVAKKEGELTLWIQVSTEENLHKKIQQVKEFYWNTEHERVEIWCRIKGKLAYLAYPGLEFKNTRMEVVPNEEA